MKKILDTPLKKQQKRENKWSVCVFMGFCQIIKLLILKLLTSNFLSVLPLFLSNLLLYTNSKQILINFFYFNLVTREITCFIPYQYTHTLTHTIIAHIQPTHTYHTNKQMNTKTNSNIHTKIKPKTRQQFSAVKTRTKVVS